MNIGIRRLIVLLSALSLAGCERARVTPLGVPAVQRSANTVEEPNPPIQTLAEAPQPIDSMEPLDDSVQEPEPESEPALVNAAVEEPPADHRLWLPTTAGPLLMDMDIRIGDRSLREAYDDSLQTILREMSATDGDLPSWKDFLDAVASAPDKFGPSGMTPNSDLDNLLRLYDLNRNGIADQEEAAKYLYRVSGTAAPFRVRGTGAFRQNNRENSKLWMAIDSNSDGQLSRLEREHAGEVIVSRFDKNGDGRIHVGEISGNTNTMSVAPWDRRKSHRRGDVAMDLDGYVDWSSLAFVLDRDETSNLFGISRNLHRDWDDDSSGSIDATESMRLGEVKADLRIEITFDNSSGADSEPLIAPVLRLVSCDPGIEPFATAAGSSSTVVIASPSFQLVVEAVKSNAPNYPSLWKTQVRGRAAEVPDAMFAWFDLDHNRSLSERELLGIPSKIATLHRASEIPDTLLVQFGRGDPNQDDGLFALDRPDDSDPQNGLPRWASGMDANRDGEISQTEFLGTREQFEKIDRNGDRFIDSWEATSSM